MLWIFTLIGEILFGIELTSFILANRIDFYVMCAIGSIIGLGISTIIFFGCSAILGMSSFHVLVHTIGISSVAYLLIMRKVIKKINLVGKPTKKHFIFFLVSIIFSFFFIPNNYLPKSHVFQANISLDMSEEISIINSFYHGVNSGLMNIFKIRHPSCYQCVCRSRWITALNSAILKLGYSPEKVSITVPSMIMIFSFCFIFLNLSHLFLDSVFGSVISLFLFFFTGGYGFTSLLYKNVRKNKNLDFIYDNGFRQSNWYHPIYYYYLSSRPSQFSLCIVSSIFYLLASTHQSYFHQKSESDGKMNEIINRKSKNRQNNRPLMTIIGVLLGLLPGNQIQVFLAILVYLLIFSINEFPFRFPRKQKEKLIEFFLLGVAFSLTSILQFLQYFPRQTNLNILVKKTIFKSLIEKGSFFPMLTFWFEALGFFPLFAFVVSWTVIDLKLMKFYFPSVIIFLWLNYILFQQVERMNMTVFYPCCMIFASIVFVETLKRLIFMWPGEEFQGFLFGISLFFVLANISSAIYGYNNLKNNRIEAWNSKIESTVNWIIQNTPKKAVFISTEENFDIVTTLAGKVQFLQSSELCKLYGFNHLNRSSEIDELLKNPNSQNLAFKVEYFVCVEDSNKKREMNTNNGNWTLEYNRHNILIYKRNLIRKK